MKRSENRELPSVAWLQRHSLFVFLLLVTIGSLRIVATYRVFSETSDEPAHIATGMEWLDKGIYQYEPQHPPLARVAAALGPYLLGIRSYGAPDMWGEGMAVLYHDGHHDRNLAFARLGILPFFWVACLVVYLFSKRYYGEPSAAFAVLFFTALPPVLAHAGLATTDMPLAALVTGSFLSAVVWLEEPSWRSTVVFGGVTGLAVLAKFSALAFIPVSFAAALIWYLVSERPGFGNVITALRTYFRPFCAAVLVGFFVIWAGYRFSVGHVAFSSLRLPAPELYAGIQQVIDHDRHGHPAYLLGERSTSGWWYYYLVALAVKTPLPFLGFLLCGMSLADRGDAEQRERRRRGTGLALAFALGILLFSSSSNINIGVRHVLPVYAGFSIVAAAGAARLLERWRTSQVAAFLLASLLVWLTATSALSHPDYLPYFNMLAGNEPERILVDSDLDWGQDIKRLCRRLNEAGADSVAFVPFFHADLAALGCPPVREPDLIKPFPGWHAVNLTLLKAWRFGLLANHDEVKLWQDQIEPTEKIGKGIWLWYFPPAAAPIR